MIMKLGDPSDWHMKRGCVAFSATGEGLGLCEIHFMIYNWRWSDANYGPKFATKEECKQEAVGVTAVSKAADTSAAVSKAADTSAVGLSHRHHLGTKSH